jgi:hypothetical protein
MLEIDSEGNIKFTQGETVYLALQFFDADKNDYRIDADYQVVMEAREGSVNGRTVFRVVGELDDGIPVFTIAPSVNDEEFSGVYSIKAIKDANTAHTLVDSKAIKVTKDGVS